MLGPIWILSLWGPAVEVAEHIVGGWCWNEVIVPHELEVTVFDQPVPAAAPPLPQVTNLDRVRAEGLADRLQGLTAARTQLDHEFLTALAEFDESRAWRWFDGITSTAHWLAWACSLAPGTAREHVRVARSLTRLPETDRLMADGQLTYSKVRELTRLVPVSDPDPEPAEPDALAEEQLPFDEERLCGLALEMTASQLARTVRAYRHAVGTRLKAETKRSLALRTRGDGLTEIRVLLPTDEAALVQAALETAQSAYQSAHHDELSQVDALLDVARGYLAADMRDPDDDHHLVTVLVDAETLAHHDDVPAGAPNSTDLLGSTREIPGLGGVEPATAARIACDCDLLGAIHDSDGHILHLGRSRRTVSRAQRRALPPHAGHGYSAHECVAALFRLHGQAA